MKIVRAEGHGRRHSTHRLGGLELDRQKREARIHGRAVPLRAKEFDLLVAFVENRDVVLGRARLLESVWGYTIPGTTRTVDVHVNHLRKKLAGSGVTIETLRGVGYRLVERSDAC